MRASDGLSLRRESKLIGRFTIENIKVAELYSDMLKYGLDFEKE